jgi:hypothetical protein
MWNRKVLSLSFLHLYSFDITVASILTLDRLQDTFHLPLSDVRKFMINSVNLVSYCNNPSH